MGGQAREKIEDIVRRYRFKNQDRTAADAAAEREQLAQQIGIAPMQVSPTERVNIGARARQLRDLARSNKQKSNGIWKSLAASDGYKGWIINGKRH